MLAQSRAFAGYSRPTGYPVRDSPEVYQAVTRWLPSNATFNLFSSKSTVGCLAQFCDDTQGQKTNRVPEAPPRQTEPQLKNVVMSQADQRIEGLLKQALAVKDTRDVERVLSELRKALEEHIRHAKVSLASQVALMEPEIPPESPAPKSKPIDS